MQTIKAGTILIKDGTPLPEALRFETEPCARGWKLVKNLDRSGVGRKLHEAGWTFFCMAGEMKVTIFGFDGQRTARRAVKRILANLRSEKFNSMEITHVVTKRFLGLPYASVFAHSRHIQESAFPFAGQGQSGVGSGKTDGRPNQVMGLARDKELPLEEMETAKCGTTLNL